MQDGVFDLKSNNTKQRIIELYQHIYLFVIYYGCYKDNT